MAAITNVTDDKISNGTLEQALRIALEESPFLSVLPEASVPAKLKEMGRRANAPLTPDIAPNAVPAYEQQGLRHRLD